MAKTKISEFSATPGNNTDIDGINIAEGCAPSGINDAIRELMAQLKDWQSGTSNDPYVIGSSGSLTLNQGTANGVAYLNGSKVLTTGSALTFDGTTLQVVNGNILLSNAYNLSARNAANTTSIALIGRNTSDQVVIDADGYGLKMGAGGALFLNGSGNLGLGVTPSAFSAGYVGFQLGGNPVIASQNNLALAGNAYYNSGWKYIASNYASRYDSNFNNGGIHAWFTAPSGTAGNAISFTQAMTLDASGNLCVGATAPLFSATTDILSLSRNHANNTDLIVNNQTNNASAASRLRLEAYGGGWQLTVPQSSTFVNPLIFSFGGTERARIDSSGNLIQTVNTTAATLTTNQTLTFSIVNNSLLRISVRGSDGTTRTATMALA